MALHRPLVLINGAPVQFQPGGGLDLGPVVALGAFGVTQSIDLSAGAVQSGSVSANCTIVLQALPYAGATSFTTLLLEKTAGVAITWPVAMQWVGGEAPDMAAAGLYVVLLRAVRTGAETVFVADGAAVEA